MFNLENKRGVIMSMYDNNDMDDLYYEMKQFAEKYSFETLLKLTKDVLTYTNADEIRIRTDEEDWMYKTDES